MSSTPGNSPINGSSQLAPGASTGPDELEVGPAIHSGRFPRWALVLIGTLLILASVAGAAYVAWRMNTGKPQVVVTASGPRTPWAMVPPLAVDEFSRDANANDTPSANPTTKTSTISATYARSGQNSVVLLMSRPEKDPKKFMADMGMNTVVATDDGYCGTSVDSNRDGCAIMRDDTAILIVDLVGQSRSDLMVVAHKFADEMAK
ncbi:MULTISPECIES: hypothetical protein [unclassified Luteococcus]|uniref:hypothetical protein n=1 Tax=unclassified Luteococcus TaxID=2639923 RepID=UPI00313D4B7B